MSYEEYLQDNIGEIPMDECLAIIKAAEEGKLSEMDMVDQLTPVIGSIFCELFKNDRETFQGLLGRVKGVAELMKPNEATYTLKPTEDSLDLLNRFSEIILSLHRKGDQILDFWWDDDTALIIVTEKHSE